MVNFYTMNQLRQMNIDDLLKHLADCCLAARNPENIKKLQDEVNRTNLVYSSKQRREIKRQTKEAAIFG